MADTLKSLVVVLITCHPLLVFGQQGKVVVEYDRQSPKYGAVNIVGLEADELNNAKKLGADSLSSFFYMKVKDASVKMLGEYTVNDSALTFKPRFLPDPSVVYEVTFDQAALMGNTTDKIAVDVKFAALANQSTRINSFYPKSDTLPSNVLRTYIHFTQPMSLQNPYDYIAIYDQEGEQLQEPFVEFSEGLWNANRTRLTLLFHPGRIKRNVGPNMKMGTIFNAGAYYTLVISKEWQDATGRELAEDYTRKFYIDAAKRDRIDVGEWKFCTPKMRTKQPFQIFTPQVIDQALADRMLKVASRSDGAVNGQWQVDKNGRLNFTPNQEWVGGEHQVLINPLLEDISGNSLRTAFDRESSEEEVMDPITTLDFTIN